MLEQELQQYLLREYPQENARCEWKEFKNLKNSFCGDEKDDVVSYVSAIANMEGGHLVIGVKDKTLEIVGTDISRLTFNGQPTDTGSSCPSARLTSCTPSTSKNRGGVSVKNVPSRNKQWFVLRVSYGRIIKAKAFVEAKGLECYVPLRYKEVRKQGKKRIITEPLLPSFLFVHASAEQVDSLLRNKNIKAFENRALLSYYYDHTSHCENAPTKNPPLIIADTAMDNFIRLTSIHNPHIIPVTSENIKYKLGDEVVITEGEFKDIHGRVTRIAGQQRVVVELFDGCLVATAYVPKEAMRKCMATQSTIIC